MSDSYQTMIDTLEQMRREVCAYDHPSLPKPPPTCDCKYANVGDHGRPLHSGEATGCPELRAAIEALRLLQALQQAGFTVLQWNVQAQQTSEQGGRGLMGKGIDAGPIDDPAQRAKADAYDGRDMTDD